MAMFLHVSFGPLLWLFEVRPSSCPLLEQLKRQGEATVMTFARSQVQMQRNMPLGP